MMPTWSGPSNVLEMKSLLEGRPPEQVELAETLLVPVIHQFGQMQMQMFDQFQQALMMMFQMFSSMHREQMDVVREEMGQIRHLTEELQAAQAELRQQAVAVAAASQAQAAPSTAPTAPAAARDPKVMAPSWSTTAGQQRRPPAERGLRRRPATAARPSVRQPPRSNTAPATAADKREPEPASAAATGGTDAARNLHAVLAHRIASLQQERQTRWQKLVQMMSRGGPGAAGGQQPEGGEVPPGR